MTDGQTAYFDLTMSLFNQGIISSDEQILCRARMHRWFVALWVIVLTAIMAGTGYVIFNSIKNGPDKYGLLTNIIGSAALGDFNKVIELNPNDAAAYPNAKGPGPFYSCPRS
jgi:hypothetical protein